MLKFVKQHLSSIAGIEIYPIISFLIFFIFFLIVTIWVLRADKKFISKMADIPLDENDNKENLKSNS